MSAEKHIPKRRREELRAYCTRWPDDAMLLSAKEITLLLDADTTRGELRLDLQASQANVALLLLACEWFLAQTCRSIELSFDEKTWVASAGFHPKQGAGYTRVDAILDLWEKVQNG